MTAQAVAVNVAGTGNTQVFTGPCTYRGYSIRENAGTAGTASVRIWDGTSATGTLLAVVELATDSSANESVPDGLRASKGVFFEVVTGTVEGSVRIG